MKTLVLILFAVMVSICQAQDKPNQTAVQLMGNFAHLWSAHDSTAIINSLASNVVLYEDPGFAKGKDAVSGWIKREMRETGTLSVSTVQSSENKDIAYQVGRWSIQRTMKNGTKGVSTGSHMFVWKKNGAAWKLAVMFITSDPEK